MQSNVVEGLQLEEEKAQHEKEEPIRLAKERLPTNHMSFHLFLECRIVVPSLEGVSVPQGNRFTLRLCGFSSGF